MPRTLQHHWPEYLIEAAGLGLFMVAAGGFATLLEYPGSPVRQAIEAPLVRRGLMGVAMGLTAIGLVYSPWGKRSGAHLNPAFTLTFLRLGKVAPWDALFYIGFQFLGGVAGLAVVAMVAGWGLADPAVNYAVTVPGPGGAPVAFVAEAGISFLLMGAVLVFINRPRLNRYTGLVVGLLLLLYITFEAPYSGMSINPARTFASALPAWLWRSFWVYLTAPPLGMLAAAEIYLAVQGRSRILCAKLHHENDQPCIFRCAYPRRIPRSSHG